MYNHIHIKEMKKICLTVLMTAFVIFAFSQDTPQKGYEYFIVLYTVGENWDTTKQAYEQQYFKEHSSHLGELRKLKKVVTGGRYSDTGMIIIKAKDETEATSIITNDISVKNKIFKVEVFSFDPFYEGCIE